MWSYKISIGQMSKNGVPRPEVCYSGNGDGKNNPAMCDVPNVGPIPPGKYSYGCAFEDPKHGPLVMRLTPLPGTNEFGRSGFLIHGDSIEHPGQASEGCIVAPHSLRLPMNASQDRILEVTA
jgi:hypothetical protein